MIVYTSVFGRTKPLARQKIKPPCRMVCYTDQDITSDVWEIIRCEPSADSALQCREYKLVPHQHFPGETTLWIDSNLSLQMDPREIASMHPSPFTAFKHRCRNRITDEVAEIIRLSKACPVAVTDQLAAYQGEGFDTPERPQTMLHENGMLLRRPDPIIDKLGEAWLDECRKHTRRDQMSLDYVAWRLGVDIAEFIGTVVRNPYMRKMS